MTPDNMDQSGSNYSRPSPSDPFHGLQVAGAAQCIKRTVLVWRKRRRRWVGGRKEGGGVKKCISHCLKFIPARHVGTSVCKYFHKGESRSSRCQTDRRNQYEPPSPPSTHETNPPTHSDCLLFPLSTEIDAPGVNWFRQSVSIRWQRGGGEGRFHWFFFSFPSIPPTPSLPPVGGVYICRIM